MSDIFTDIRKIFLDDTDRVFVTNGLDGSKYSIADMLEAADQLNKLLSAKGAAKGAKVAYLLDNSIEHFILILGALFGGYTAIPIDPWRGSSEIKRILEISHPDILISAEVDLWPACQIHPDEIKVWQTRDMPPEHKHQTSYRLVSMLPGTAMDDSLLVTFTSGSTGEPKGVVHSYRDLHETSLAFADCFNFGAESVFFHNFPMAYMAGILNQFLLPLITGSSVVIGERFSVSGLSRFWEIPSQYNANTFWLNPTIMSLLLKLDRGDEGSAILERPSVNVLVGTAPLTLKLKLEFEARYGISVHESYGLSETLFVSTNSPNIPYREGSVGKYLSGVQIKKADDAELIIEAPWMFKGYLGDRSGESIADNKASSPEELSHKAGESDKTIETRQDEISAGFMSGDLGYIDDDGYVFITGRKKDIIIRGGMNVSPVRIEEILANLNIFSETTVMGIADDLLGERIVCFYAASVPTSKEELKKANQLMVEKLGRDHHIDEFRQVPEIPKNINGKVDKIVLQSMLTEGQT